MLAPGSRGVDVRELQRDLAAAGFDPGPVDGIFGGLTRRAVVELQRYCRLPADGIAGPLTQEALRMLLPHQPLSGRRLSEHFTEREFLCRCGCGILQVNVHLVTMLENLRFILGGRPITIVSGYRCSDHNRAVGGASCSQHLRGNAADLVVSGAAADEVAAAADALNFPGVGRYPAFTHVDVRPCGPARWIG